MNGSSPTIPSREVLALVRGELPPQRAERLRAQIRDDEVARALFDRLAEAEEAFSPASPRARMEARLFAKRARSASARSWRPWAQGLAGLATTLGVVALMVQNSSLDGYRARGTGSVDGSHVLQVLTARVSEDGKVTVKPASIVRPNDPLRFAVLSRKRDAEVSLIVVGSTGRKILLTRAKVSASDAVERLNFAYRVPESWSGLWHIVAVFEHGTRKSLQTLNLEPRDEPDLSVRTVQLRLENERR